MDTVMDYPDQLNPSEKKCQACLSPSLEDIDRLFREVGRAIREHGYFSYDSRYVGISPEAYEHMGTQPGDRPQDNRGGAMKKALLGTAAVVVALLLLTLVA